MAQWIFWWSENSARTPEFQPLSGREERAEDRWCYWQDHLLFCSIYGGICAHLRRRYCSVVNVIGDLVFAAGLGMNVAGAAFATILAQNVGAGKEERAARAMHTRMVLVMLQGISASFLVRVPLSYLFSLKEGANLFDIGLAVPAASVYGIIFFTVCYLRFWQKRKKRSRMA